MDAGGDARGAPENSRSGVEFFNVVPSRLAPHGVDRLKFLIPRTSWDSPSYIEVGDILLLC